MLVCQAGQVRPQEDHAHIVSEAFFLFFLFGLRNRRVFRYVVKIRRNFLDFSQVYRDRFRPVYVSEIVFRSDFHDFVRENPRFLFRHKRCETNFGNRTVTRFSNVDVSFLRYPVRSERGKPPHGSN